MEVRVGHVSLNRHPPPFPPSPPPPFTRLRVNHPLEPGESFVRSHEHTSPILQAKQPVPIHLPNRCKASAAALASVGTLLPLLSFRGLRRRVRTRTLRRHLALRPQRLVVLWEAKQLLLAGGEKL